MAHEYNRDTQRRIVALVGFVLFVIFPLIYLLCDYFVRKTRSKHVGPITKFPFIPFDTQSFTQIEGINGTRFYLGYYRRPITPSFTRVLYSLMNAAGSQDSIPPANIRIISIKMNGFKIGNLCHEFIPVNQQSQSGYYIYQMFGNDKIQATFYVENDINYLAGICIYVEKCSQWHIDYRREVIEDLMKYPKYHQRVQEIREIPPIVCTESTNIIDSVPSEKWNVQFCNRIGRDLMTTSLNEVAYHKEWNPVVNQWVAQKCTDCSRNLDLPPAYDSIVSII